MKRFSVFLIAIAVVLLSGCSSQKEVACLDAECAAANCIEEQVLNSKKDGMLDFCQPPAFGTFAIKQHGITWTFAESVSYGQFVNGDYWVLDKGDGVTVKSVSPGPSDNRHGSMINPTVGAQAYDDTISYYNPSLGVEFPVVLKGGDSLVSTISVTDADLNEYGKVSPSWYHSSKGLGHARLITAAVLTVVSEVPKSGSFRPPYVGTDKKIYNISDINKSLVSKYKAPSKLPDVSYYERGLERVWLMHLPGWTARKMHPSENMRNYHRDLGIFLSDASLILLTDGSTDKLLRSFIQTGIDHYYTIINGAADSATFEFHSILTGMLLGDEKIARVWVDGRSRTVGRAVDKFYFPEQKESTMSSEKVASGSGWTGAKVLFRKQPGDTEHEHLHPSEWGDVDNGGGIKQESYRQCCDSVPHFGMAMASRALKADKYWPTSALDLYLDRWVWESQNGYGLDEIQLYYPTFYSDVTGNGARKYLVGSNFADQMFETLGFDANVSQPTVVSPAIPDTTEPDDSSTDSDTDTNTGSPDTGANTGSSDTDTNTGSPDTGANTGSSDTGANTGSPDTGANTGSSDTGANTGSPDTGANTGSSDTGANTGSSDTGVNTGSSNTGANTGSSDTGVNTGVNTGSSDTGTNTGSSSTGTNTGSSVDSDAATSTDDSSAQDAFTKDTSGMSTTGASNQDGEPATGMSTTGAGSDSSAATTSTSTGTSEGGASTANTNAGTSSADSSSTSISNDVSGTGATNTGTSSTGASSPNTSSGNASQTGSSKKNYNRKDAASGGNVNTRGNKIQDTRRLPR